MKLFNIDNTANDKHKSGKDWIDVLAEYKRIFSGKNIPICNHIGAHMSDHPGDDSSSSESSEPVTPDTPKKKGCGGSIVAASSLMALVAVMGLGVILAKRKED